MMRLLAYSFAALSSALNSREFDKKLQEFRKTGLKVKNAADLQTLKKSVTDEKTQLQVNLKSPKDKSEIDETEFQIAQLDHFLEFVDEALTHLTPEHKIPGKVNSFTEVVSSALASVFSFEAHKLKEEESLNNLFSLGFEKCQSQLFTEDAKKELVLDQHPVMALRKFRASMCKDSKDEISGAIYFGLCKYPASYKGKVVSFDSETLVSQHQKDIARVQAKMNTFEVKRDQLFKPRPKWIEIWRPAYLGYYYLSKTQNQLRIISNSEACQADCKDHVGKFSEILTELKNQWNSILNSRQNFN